MTDGLKYHPSSLTVPAGTTITWINVSKMGHTVTADKSLASDASDAELPQGAEAFNSGMIRPGATWKHTLTVPGHYRYFCIPHEQLGMVGEVIVTPGNKSAGTKPTGGPQAGSHPGSRHPSNRFLAVLYWLGNFHPAAVNFPVAMLTASAVAALLLLIRPRRVYAEGLRFCLMFGIVSAWVAAFLGWCFGGFNPATDNWLLATHRWLGTGTAVWALVLALLYRYKRHRGGHRARLALIIAILIGAALVSVTGFFGGAMVFGLGHYARY